MLTLHATLARERESRSKNNYKKLEAASFKRTNKEKGKKNNPSNLGVVFIVFFFYFLKLNLKIKIKRFVCFCFLFY